MNTVSKNNKSARTERHRLSLKMILSQNYRYYQTTWTAGVPNEMAECNVRWLTACQEADSVPVLSITDPQI